MTTKELLQLTDVSNLIKSNICEFIVERDNLNNRGYYVNLIQENVKESPGVYVWTNDENNKIIYIGMSGKINNDGTLGNQLLPDRLQASRKYNGKDLSTKNYLFIKLNELKIQTMKMSIFYSNENEPASYLEAKLLRSYFQNQGRLPILNNEF
ncbi:MAG: hypothetical protein H8E84_04985 [Flavobacteriales bacterium]|nr:hypothetical protein [Flavobacteriales bacterium]